MCGCGIEAISDTKGDGVMRNQTWTNFRVGLPLFLRDEFCTALLFIASFVQLEEWIQARPGAPEHPGRAWLAGVAVHTNGCAGSAG